MIRSAAFWLARAAVGATVFLVTEIFAAEATPPVASWTLADAERDGFTVHGDVASGGGLGAVFRGGHLTFAADNPQLVALRGEAFTLHVRAKLPMVIHDHGTIICRQTADAKAGFRVFVTDNKEGRRLVCEVAFDGKRDRPLRVGVPLTKIFKGVEHWNNIVVRFTGPKLDLFVDGVLVDEEWPIGAIVHAAAEPLLLGKRSDRAGTHAPFTGHLETLTFWNRAVADEEVMALSGGASAIGKRESEILGLERPVKQYWHPRGFDTGVGDCMPFFHDGVFHLFYLFDRDGHGSKWGLGAHQWAHVSTTDLRTWSQHPLAVAITSQTEGSICTGSVFEHDGVFHAFYAIRSVDGSPAHLTSSRSTDGIHFEKTGWSMTLQPPYQGPPARDPVIFRNPQDDRFHMLVTTELIETSIARRGGCLAHLVSRDLQYWEQREPFLVPGFPDQPECPDYFAWNGWHYLIFSNNGIARYRMSLGPLGPWLTPRVDTFDGPQGRVMKTAAFTGGRRLGAQFLPHTGVGYAGQLVLREIVQHEDGTLGSAFPTELMPALAPPMELRMQPLAGNAAGDASRLTIDAGHGLGVAAFDGLPRNYRLRFRINAAAGATALGIAVRGSGRYEKGNELRWEADRAKLGWRKTDAGTTVTNDAASIYSIAEPRDFDVVVKDDILDVCVDQRRTLVARAEPEFHGNRLFLFAQNGTAIFENIRVEPLTEQP